MMRFDATTLSRIQFAWVIGWHILLPAFTMGIASYIALLEGLYLKTKRVVYIELSNFWIHVFAVAFGMGVVTGVVMPFQFGTNWSRFTDAAGNVVGPLMAYEGLIAFFLESAFLGILLFGRKLVPAGMHFASAILVALGTLFSSFWILATNSWMQTPAGHELHEGRIYPVDWFQIIFSPSFPFRLAHTVVAFYVTAAFVVLGVGAYTIRRAQFAEAGRVMVNTASWLLVVLVPLQALLGDAHGLNTREYQPAKLAAIEARWDTGSGVPLTLFAIPDQAGEANKYSVEVPLLGSLILTHSFDGTIRGLKEFPKEDRPPVAIVFFAFRIMVGLAVIMLMMVMIGVFLRIRGRLFQSSRYLKFCEFTIPIGFIAVLAGWTTTEVGRQPWTVYGVLRTADSVTPSLVAGDVLLSLTLYAVAYFLIYLTGFWYMLRLIQRGPAHHELRPPVEAGLSANPIQALPTREPTQDVEE
jgi:cytochrome bd ubiquinol oxidase subunit I